MSGSMLLVVVGVAYGVAYAWGGLLVVLVLESRLADCISRLTRDRTDLGMLLLVAWPVGVVVAVLAHAWATWQAARQGMPRPARG